MRSHRNFRIIIMQGGFQWEFDRHFTFKQEQSIEQ